MDLLKISKILDYVTLLAVVALVAVYLFVKLSFVYTSLFLIFICIVKMLAYMLRAKYYQREYENIKDEGELYRAKSEALEKELKEIKNK